MGRKNRRKIHDWPKIMDDEKIQTLEEKEETSIEDSEVFVTLGDIKRKFKNFHPVIPKETANRRRRRNYKKQKISS